MNGKLGAFGLALVFAMAALSAATASAEQWHAAEHGTVVGVNVGEEVITTKAGTVKCQTTIYRGTSTTSTVSTQNVVPEYTGCTAFGFVSTTVDVPKGCEFRFNTPVATTSTIDIVGCPATEPITVTAFNCWVTIGNQNGLSHVAWSNVSGSFPMDIHATFTVNNITYTQHPKKFPECTKGTFTSGEWVGTNTVKAFNTPNSQVDYTVT